MAPPIAASAVVACIPDNVSPVAIGSGGSGQATSNKNCYFNEDTFKLIECVRVRPALWHRKHLRQRVQVAHRGWEEIRKAFKATEVTSLKIRWKTLRDSFRREVKRIEDGEIVTSSWPLFENMSFLIGHFRTRESYLKNTSSSLFNQSKSQDYWELVKNESKMDEEPLNNNTTYSMGESENDGGESFVTYDSTKTTNFETVPMTGGESVDVDVDGTGGRPADECDPDELTLVDAYETLPSVARRRRDASPSNQEVIELPAHMFGEVTFKNKLRARIKTEPVEKLMEGGCGMEADSDYSFLMSLHPFMKQLAGKQNLAVRIKIQQAIAEAMDEK